MSPPPKTTSLGQVWTDLVPLAQTLADHGADFGEVAELSALIGVYRWFEQNRPEAHVREIAAALGISHPTLYRRRQRLRALTGWDVADVPPEIPVPAIGPGSGIAFAT